MGIQKLRSRQQIYKQTKKLNSCIVEDGEVKIEVE